MIKIYLDLDGVLADFASGVRHATGNNLTHYKDNAASLWKDISHSKNFFTNLATLPDGMELWDSVKEYSPIILSGVPHGSGWDLQKREWVDTFLGEDVPLIIKYPHHSKMYYALKHSHLNTIPQSDKWILIDDTISNASSWIDTGGIFLHYRNTAETIEQLSYLLV